MTHLVVSRHYPPAPGGGIGTYLGHITRLLVESGETVHVIARQHATATSPVEELHGGRLVVHRLPVPRKGLLRRVRAEGDSITDELHHIGSGALRFAWEASHYAERLIESQSVDVIEVQDYQAPLYFFQLRRALGLGPRRLPPIVVHLHSPTEMIVEKEDVDVSQSELARMRRMERFAIAAADSLLAPSKYQAQQVAATFSVSSPIEVIPLPIGSTNPLERPPQVWENGSICFVGRLEPRKGVYEWVAAAVEVARDDPRVIFDFVGRDDRTTLEGVSAREAIMRGFPEDLRARFRFFGNQPQERLHELLGRARAVVVPSRWESFSYVCAEALASGVPVLATPVGAMPNMVIHGENGWLAGNGTPDALGGLLREILATPPQHLAQMGARAATSIRDYCEPSWIFEAHLDLKRRVVEAGAVVSTRLPERLNWLTSRAAPPPPPSSPAMDGIRSIAIMRLNGDRSWPWEEGLARVASGNGPPPLGVIFLNDADRADDQLDARCAQVLRARPEVGIVTCWTRQEGRVRFSLPPALPMQWVHNEAPLGSCIRWEALEGVRLHRLLDDAYTFWNLVNHILAAGWTAITVPEVLIEREADSVQVPSGSISHTFMMRRLLEPHWTLISPDAMELIADLKVGGAQPALSAQAVDDGRGLVRTVIAKLGGKS